MSTPTTSSSPVEFSHVSKWYGDTVALSDVSFALRPGVTGLLGHNGAGKSTSLSLLAGYTGPSQGSVRVLGKDPRTDPSVHEQLGVVPDGDGLWPFLTARQTVEMLASQRRVKDPAAAAVTALERVGLTGSADRKVNGFSKGMRQRVKLAQALAHDPQVLILDEPLNGLDPAQRRADVELIRRLGGEGRTVLVSSHVLTEVERMADRLLVVVNGRLVAEGTGAGIRDLMTDRPRSIRIRTPAARELGGRLLAEGVVHGVEIEEDVLVVQTLQALALAGRLPRLARELDVLVHRVEPQGEDLESVFSALTSSARGVGR
ncbi:ABC-2 type transport system ATP-binding protein [Motilibacter rhizosphaerae]|uniref:ABC-2 type transport system ATP-binding protein n=1 Tax=Motilibacter rhizosphaerae TaxID=598652 RepID=A0A4Q7NTU2_9ACTN|nr:ABC transporter ATP-binding protein [Motilibacter rhizosphaerae]RZS90238.1 ABC-2 type transport system ATP-binding protein [Motilibacter rhizosphaerae]